MSSVKYKKTLELKPPIINNPLSEIIIHSQKKKILTFKKDEYLFHEGDTANGIQFIITGKIKVLKTDAQNHPSILYLAQRGDTLGIHAVVNEHPHSSSAIALVKSYTCFIPTDEFLRIIEAETRYKIIIMQMLCTKIDLLENKMNNQFIKSIPERFIDSLLFLIQTYGMDDNQILNIGLSQEDLANMVGTSKTYLNKIIIDLHKKGIMSFKNQKIHISDLGELKLYTGKQ